MNHGAAVAPDGSRYYISNEARSTLDVVDQKTLKVTKSIPLSGHPNNIAISKDGKRVYVSIAVAPGAVDVIDTASLEKVKSIPVKGAVHNTYVTPDGKYVVSGSIHVQDHHRDRPEDRRAGVVAHDGPGHSSDGVRDQSRWSTKWIFVQLSGFNGFAVVDFATHKEINRIKLPDLPAGKAPFMYGGNESHGMAVTADGKTLVVNSRLNSAIYSYSLPDLKLLGSADVGQIARLGDAHAGRQDGLCGLRGVELRVGGGHQVHERDHAHSGRVRFPSGTSRRYCHSGFSREPTRASPAIPDYSGSPSACLRHGTGRRPLRPLAGGSEDCWPSGRPQPLRAAPLQNCGGTAHRSR